MQTSSFGLLVMILVSMTNTGLWIKIRYRVMSSLFYFVHCGLIYYIDVDSCHLGQKVSMLLTMNQFINLISVSIFLSNSPLHAVITVGLAIHKLFYSGTMKIEHEVMETLFTVSTNIILFGFLSWMFSSGCWRIQLSSSSSENSDTSCSKKEKIPQIYKETSSGLAVFLTQEVPITFAYTNYALYEICGLEGNGGELTTAKIFSSFTQANWSEMFSD